MRSPPSISRSVISWTLPRLSSYTSGDAVLWEAFPCRKENTSINFQERFNQLSRALRLLHPRLCHINALSPQTFLENLPQPFLGDTRAVRGPAHRIRPD
ncbi:hypothetical protein HMPREF0972_01431 [Actinomyces sp. oral taxon 848 str. F0332]|nr:hypothetical protein HMPREF0972_01431 [Actinomyces sp. oral taxon 848 str. F0332]